MDSKKVLMLLILVSAIFLTVGYLFTIPNEVGFCSGSKICEINNVSGIGQPLVYGSLSIITVLVALLFMPKVVFSAWRKFAVFYVPITILWVISTPVIHNGFITTPIDYRLGLAKIVSVGFLIISFLIIAIKSWRLKNSSN